MGVGVGAGVELGFGVGVAFGFGVGVAFGVGVGSFLSRYSRIIFIPPNNFCITTFYI